MPKAKTTKKKVVKNLNKKTYVAFVLDESGSMCSIEKQARNGINEQIQTLKADAEKMGDTFVSVISFNNNTNIRRANLPLSEVVELAPVDYHPSGGTAMYDAVWDAIELLKKTERAEDTSYLVVVISDGEENSSRRVCGTGLADEIKKLQETGEWTFPYMLANQDLAKVTRALNLSAGNVQAFMADSAGMMAASYTNNSALSNYAMARSVGTKSVNNFYAQVEPPKPTDGSPSQTANQP